LSEAHLTTKDTKEHKGEFEACGQQPEMLRALLHPTGSFPSEFAFMMDPGKELSQLGERPRPGVLHSVRTLLPCILYPHVTTKSPFIHHVSTTMHHSAAFPEVVFDATVGL
jgi:hypothetical protein